MKKTRSKKHTCLLTYMCIYMKNWPLDVPVNEGDGRDLLHAAYFWKESFGWVGQSIGLDSSTTRYIPNLLEIGRGGGGGWGGGVLVLFFTFFGDIRR